MKEETKAVEAVEPARLDEPWALGGCVWYARPGTTPAIRYANERRVYAEVEAYLRRLGFEPDAGGVRWEREWRGQKVRVSFYYVESWMNVYRRLEVFRDGRRSNIRLLRRIAAEREEEAQT